LDVVDYHVCVGSLESLVELAVCTLGILELVELSPHVLVDCKLSCCGILAVQERLHVPLGLVGHWPHHDLNIVQFGNDWLRAERGVGYLQNEFANLAVDQLEGKPVLLKDIWLEADVL